MESNSLRAANLTAHGDRLLRLGVLLFLLGLLTGFAIPALTNPRMGLTSHLEGADERHVPGAAGSAVAAARAVAALADGDVLDRALRHVRELGRHAARRDLGNGKDDADRGSGTLGHPGAGGHRRLPPDLALARDGRASAVSCCGVCGLAVANQRGRSMPDFVPGLVLASRFYREAIDRCRPHHWGPRAMILLRDEDHRARAEEILRRAGDAPAARVPGMADQLRRSRPGRPRHPASRAQDQRPVDPLIDVLAVSGSLLDYLGFAVDREPEPLEWLTYPQPTERGAAVSDGREVTPIAVLPSRRRRSRTPAP